MGNIQEQKLAASIRKHIVDIISYKMTNNVGFITITDVRVSKDISYADVYVSFFPEQNIEERMNKLINAQGFIRSELSHKLKTRRCPTIRFVLDDGFMKERKITEALKKD